MNPTRDFYAKNNEGHENAKSVRRSSPQDATRQKNYNWKISNILVQSAQKNVILQRTSTYLVCNYKDKLRNACPADIKTLKYCTDIVQDESKSEERIKPTDTDYEEQEAHLDTHPSELIELPKVRIWDEYKKLVESSRLRPRRRPTLKPELSNVTSLPKIRIDRSIIKIDPLQRILVVDTNYVQFRNFELKKVYKKVVTLQNVSNAPARFQIEPRPYRSKFRVIVNPVIENRSIVPPGMQLQLIILFRCDDIDEPEEMLVLNVQHGRSLIIRLHGYKDPPILFGTCMLEKITCKRSNADMKLLEQSSNADVVTSFHSINVFYSLINNDNAVTWSTIEDSFVSTTFDCKKSFVGEEVYIPIKFENAGGEGRFFIMSETDWFTMDIKDITSMNVLELPCFTISPAYFSLKANDEMILHMSFTPDCYGIHPFEKVWSFKRNIDKRAKYYVNLSTSVPDGIGQCVISVSNVSEICMNFKWQKRDAQSDDGRINEENYFPLEFLHIKPDRGIFTPTSVHYFTITAEYKNLDPNYYVAILQLYVEDIPLKAIPNISEIQTKKSTTRHRKCLTSVDIWVADVEIWLQYMMDDESKTCVNIVFKLFFTQPEMNHPKEYELFSHYDLVDLKQFEPDNSNYFKNINSFKNIIYNRALFIGIEETYILMLKNLANNSLNYSWGEVNGLDSKKMKLCVCPEKGEVSVGNGQKIEITFTPIKEGIVQSLFIPCFIGDSRKIIMLGIECSIKPLYVTFYLPLGDEESLELRNNFTRVEWRVDSLKHAFDVAGKSKKHMKILDKYRMREERELMNTNLDQGEVLKDASTGPSMHEVAAEESAEQSYASTSTSEIIQVIERLYRFPNLMTQSEKYSQDIVPVFEKIFPLPQQPVVIEFLGLKLRTVKKKTLIIKNETSIPTNFWLCVKNFYPITCSCEGKTQEDQIKIIYKRVHGQQKGLIEETLHKMKQPGSGVVIYIDPLNSEIGPFQAIPIDVYVFADTWGIYVDEVEINITGLPQYTIGICVQVVGSPVTLSISDKNEFNVPVIKYGIEAAGVRLEDRKIVLKNTSVVPIVIDWHTFLVKPPTETKPFNVAFDLCTPFTNKLASKLRASKQKSDSEMHLEEHKNVQRTFRGLHTCDSIEISNVTDISSSYSYRDNYCARQSGYYFPPIEIDITANIIKPKLHFDISKFDRTFTCFVNDVMLSRKKRLEKPGQSLETLEIISDIPYNTEECQLYGEGTLDEKYHTPGV
ncbi:Deleted in lung and esophageal cancer protein 1 [Habropoda laboriosa]|uniref:Deleted in lung and esophageal cancer protein 1 n=1 Tax=Habropoda laboriosa TaxID=597456 RepID=A0A0L7QXA7_9HYME|nr:Deleted in lung and esophageal cancer protein 1 [Habropoda laboriosa]